VLDPLAVKVLGGEFKEGDTVTVDVRANEIVFTKKGVAVATG